MIDPLGACLKERKPLFKKPAGSRVKRVGHSRGVKRAVCSFIWEKRVNLLAIKYWVKESIGVGKKIIWQRGRERGVRWLVFELLKESLATLQGGFVLAQNSLIGSVRRSRRVRELLCLSLAKLIFVLEAKEEKTAFWFSGEATLKTLSSFFFFYLFFVLPSLHFVIPV